MNLNYLDSQVHAIAKLSKVKCGALFMEAGTGKTRTALTLVKALDTDYVLWITPFRTKVNLREELCKWGGLACDIVGIESISASSSIYLKYHSLCQKHKKVTLILDESLKIKNRGALRTKRLLALAKLAEYRLILNGTPLSKNLLDLWSQMEFLSPKILKMGFPQFKHTFCEYVQINTYHKNRKKQIEFIKKYHNVEYLYALIKPFIFESNLSLSVGIQNITLDFCLSDEEMATHNKLKNTYLNEEWLSKHDNNVFLHITQKMQHSYSMSKEKILLTKEYLKAVDKSKVLIIANYVNSQNRLKTLFKDVMVLSLNKHSFGLNLQKYHTIIFWDKTWDYALREQAERRIFRVGQTNKCTYVDFKANVGLDRLIDENIDRKRDLLEIFKKYSVEELKELL